MAQGATLPVARQSRFWFYAPFALLALVAVAWSVAWFVIRDQTAQALDRWLAAEAADGRQWTCADRSVSGYPFRIEIACSAVTFHGHGVTGSVGRVHAVAQVYQPRHVITEIAGPLRLSDGRATAQGEWRLLETSIRTSRDGLRRASVIADAPRLRVTGAAPEEIALSAEAFQAHLRPNPTRAGTDDAVDLAANARGVRFPALDALVGGAEPANLQADLTVTQSRGFARGVGPDEVERWRAAGGEVEVLLLSLAKGDRRLEAKGTLRLDDQHRPAGQLTLAGAGLDGVIAHLTGGRGGSMLGALLGQKPGANANGALAPLPPVRIENGRIALGPFAVPGARVPPLY